MSGATEAEIRTRAEEAGQGHLFRTLEQATAADRRLFFGDLAGMDWGLIARLRDLLRSSGEPAAVELEPAPSVKKGADPAADAAARARGEELLAAGKVAVFVVAGGQGSRLGYDGPKGLYPATPVRGRSLFEVFAAKILACSRRHGVALPWYLMTSRANHEATVAYFAENANFCLAPNQLRFFSQDMLPAMDEEGRFLLEAPGRLFMSPNGHGGSLLALATSGALAEMKALGIEQIFYFQVDNPLAVIADPVFLGHHDLAGAEMSTKVVAKRDAGEKVGVVGLVGGRYGVIEYSDLSEAERTSRDQTGRLRFRDGNIAIHAIRRDFVEELTRGGLDLPFHLARKSIPAICPETAEPRPTKGVKFETFVFDALARCRSSVVLEVDRAEEFAPIKNAEGEDSPASSRAAQTELFARWLASAGHPVPRDEDGRSRVAIEIDPRFADSAEALRARGIGAPDFGTDVVLE
ncbi:MAG: UTP--glucose-1-phosphate uridylyltransferase [Planctomycetes bacterium]|nr:UTP--glucose-1-phosphate uridylyltransferase [Planctomycetota bacterium]